MKERDVAYHEAAHAVAAAFLGILADGSVITIKADGAVLGSAEFSNNAIENAWKNWPKPYTRKAILAFYAGPAATMRSNPGINIFEEGGFCELDMIRANELSQWIGEPAYLTHGRDLVLATSNWKKTVKLVAWLWPAISNTAELLIKKKKILGRDVKAIVSWARKSASNRKAIYRNRARKAAYLLAGRVRHWLKTNPGKTVVDALRAERKRTKSRQIKTVKGVLKARGKVMPVTIYKNTVRKDRGLSALPELSKVEALLYRHWRYARDGKPAFRTLTDQEIADLLPVAMSADTLKKIRERLGLLKVTLKRKTPPVPKRVRRKAELERMQRALATYRRLNR